MYSVSEVVEIDTAQNLILEVTAKEVDGSDDIFTLRQQSEADFDE